LKQGVNSPLTSSAGRLFDAAAALLGLCRAQTFEGEAAMALEYAAEETDEWYPLTAVVPTTNERGSLILDWRTTLSSLVDAHAKTVPTAMLARGFHMALADAIVASASQAGVNDVVLTGGCFQNALLAGLAHSKLTEAGFKVHLHRQTPPNDGGLAVGQAAFAAHPLREEIN
jgi:hydrogenase maturation protein HypF